MEVAATALKGAVAAEIDAEAVNAGRALQTGPAAGVARGAAAEVTIDEGLARLVLTGWQQVREG